MPEATELIAIGRIVKPFGVRGQVRVRSLSDVPGRFQNLTALGRVTLVAPSGSAVDTTVNGVREEGRSSGYYVLGFAAFSTPEEAAMFRGGLIKITRDRVPPLPTGQYYEFELVGMAVSDETGGVLGTLAEVLHTGGHSVFVVRGEGREHLVPASKEVVISVDVERRTMMVRPIEGLLDDHAAR